MCTLQLVDRTPFFYVIRNIETNIKYAGIKFSKGCKPSDLLTTYFTSSKTVKKLLATGSKFVVDKIIEFETKENAIEFEELFLTDISAHISAKWYNLSAGRAINPDHVKTTMVEKYGVDNFMKTDLAKGRGFKSGNTFGCFKRSDETKNKMSIAFSGRVFSESHREKIRQSKLGLKPSQMTKNKMSENRIGKPRPDSWHLKMAEYRENNPNPMLGKASPMRGKHYPVIACEHCEVKSSKGNYNRWHGNNCRQKIIGNNNG